MLNLNKLYIFFRLRLYPSWPLSFLVQNLIFVSTWKLRFNILTGNSNFYIHLSSPMFPIYLLQNPSSTTALTDDSLIICNKRNFCLHEADIFFGENSGTFFHSVAIVRFVRLKRIQKEVPRLRFYWSPFLW